MVCITLFLITDLKLGIKIFPFVFFLFFSIQKNIFYSVAQQIA